MNKEMKLLIMFALALGLLASVPAWAANVLPETALGEWCKEPSSAPCDEPDGITKPMMIRPRELSNYMDYEADGVNCRIKRINKVTDFYGPQWRVDLNVDCSNGKDKWHRYRGRMFWHLTSERLIIVTPPGEILVYVREKSK